MSPTSSFLLLPFNEATYSYMENVCLEYASMTMALGPVGGSVKAIQNVNEQRHGDVRMGVPRNGQTLERHQPVTQ